MHSRRIVLSETVAAQRPLTLTGSAWQYAARVLRLRVGDVLRISNGQGREWVARIAASERNSFVLDCLEEIVSRTESPLAIHLFAGLTKGAKLEWVVQKTTELGVHRLVPVVCERSQVKPHAERTHKGERWREIARQASRQCGRVQLPEISAPVTFAESLAESGQDGPNLLLDPGKTVEKNCGVFGSPANCPGGPPRTARIWVGPEGGFTAEEVAAGVAAGLALLGLGPRILRAETACIAAVTLVQWHWGDLRESLSASGDNNENTD